MNPTLSQVLTFVLQIGASLAGDVPAIIAAFELANKLIAENRDPTAAEWAALTGGIDQAHTSAQAALNGLIAAKTAAATVTAPVVMATAQVAP